MREKKNITFFGSFLDLFLTDFKLTKKLKKTAAIKKGGIEINKNS